MSMTLITHDHWQAELRLRFTRRAHGSRTVLSTRQHRGPLVVQRPFHPEGDPCHTYIVHPPGGVVGGDQLEVHVQVHRAAHALVTTPAATKFYRSRGVCASLRQQLQAAESTLEWLPQENIYYRGCRVHNSTRIDVGAGSRFVGWEIGCLGLPARGEKFDDGELRLDFELWRGAAPVLIDRMRLDGCSPARDARWGLDGREAIGTLLATPATAAHVEIIRPLLAEMPQATVTLVDGVLVMRALAAQGEAVRALFIAAWRLLRPAIIGRVAVDPRIWAT